MADLSTIARPYAKAVFELARESGKLKEWSAQLAAIAAVIADKQVAELVGSPALSRAQLAALLGELLKRDVNSEGQSLLRMLAENGRLKAAPLIAGQYEALRAEAELRVDVEITSAAPVAAEQQQTLASAIKKRLARDVAVEWKTDDSLIGGAVIRAGDLVIDGSVRGELERLQTALAR
ncbi:MAG TPA: F0F1 ATP synthase subunit delta [Nevskiaceae bacterium]|nr:F0F1 ATP synthase subunit delta [Nevskiaceae bacterium]